jgi:hypothetical protein
VRAASVSSHLADQHPTEPEPTRPPSYLNGSSLDGATDTMSNDRLLRNSPLLRDSETPPEHSLMKNITNPEAAADHDRRKSVAVLAVEQSGGSARVNDNQDNSFGSGSQSFPNPDARKKPLMHTDKRAEALDGHESELDKVSPSQLGSGSGDEPTGGVTLNMRSRSSSDPTNDRVSEEPRAEGTSSVPSNPQSSITSAPTGDGVAEEFLRQLDTRNQAQLANSAELQRQLEESSARFDKLLRKFRRARRRQTAGAEEDETDSEEIECSRNRRREKIQCWMAFLFILSIIAFMIYFFTVTIPFKHLIFHGDI